MSAQQPVRSVVVLAACLGLSFGGCAPKARYVVSSRPFDVGIGPVGFCVAVDPQNQQGIWWWQAGATDCDSRITSQVFKALNADVSAGPSGRTEASFRLGTHSRTRPYVDVRLVFEGDVLRVVGSDVDVPTLRRTDLSIPEWVSIPRRQGG